MEAATTVRLTLELKKEMAHHLVDHNITMTEFFITAIREKLDRENTKK